LGKLGFKSFSIDFESTVGDLELKKLVLEVCGNFSELFEFEFGVLDGLRGRRAGGFWSGFV